MSSEIIFAPRNDGEAVYLSAAGAMSKWRKKLLRRGKINYNGREIDFNEDYFKNIVRAFDEKAMDQVPLQLAGDDNKHGLDVKRYGGEATRVFLDDDGDLSADYDFPAETAEIIRKNPKLGVSAGLAINPDRADGKKYPVVLGHVLATLDPKIKGLGDWTPVELSNAVEDAVITDLSAVEMETTDGQREITPERLAELTAEEIEAFTPEELESWVKAIVSTAPPVPVVAPVIPEPVVAPVVKEPVVADLSVTPEERAIELANAARTRADLDTVRAQLATQKWERLRAEYTSAGVPPAVVALAQPLLEVPEDTVVELSETNSVNASDVVRKLLDEWAGFVKLGVEKGLNLSVADEKDPQADADEALLELFKNDPAFKSL